MITVLAALLVLIHTADRLFYWIVQERDWKQSNDDLTAQLMNLNAQMSGMVSVVEEYKRALNKRDEALQQMTANLKALSAQIAAKGGGN